MRIVLVLLALNAPVSPAYGDDVAAQLTTADSGVCIVIDEARDTLMPQDRTAAILFLTRQFELAGRRVSDNCAAGYTVAHVQLGEHIFVTLSGAGQTREGTATGLSDLPSLYSQMVRSILSGRPMTGFNVVDRTNVTTPQASAKRVHSDRYGYARLGYGAISGDHVYGAPSMGFGYRVELDSIGLDVSFLNWQGRTGTYGSSSSAMTSALLKLQALHFVRPTANASPYFGGGLSWGISDFGGGSVDYRSPTYRTSWHGSGLQGELTFGYELPRASTFRVFVEANAVLPFYAVASTTYPYPGTDRSTTIDRRYAPSLVVSVGVGWQRSRER